MSEKSQDKYRGRRFDLQDFVSLVAVLVATAAALAAVYETRIVARHQAISVWPYLQMFAGVATDEDLPPGVQPFSFNFANKGVGPAIIETIAVRRNGEPVAGLFQVMLDVARDNELDPRTLSMNESNLDEGEVVEAGEVRAVIGSGDRAFAVVMAQEIYSRRSLEVEVCYCSLYEECWRLTFPQSRPREVAACRAAD